MSRKTTNILRINTPKDVYLITGDTKIIIGFDEAIDQEEIGSIGQNDNGPTTKASDKNVDPVEPEKLKKLSITKYPNNKLVINAGKIPVKNSSQKNVTLKNKKSKI